MKIWEILQEAVGGNYLYHGVRDGRTMAQILKSGKILPMEVFDFDRDTEMELNGGKEPPPRISLTRDQYLHFPYGDGVAQFVIDRNVLRQKGYKIRPTVGAMIAPKAETEELVYKPIPVTAPYVVEIQYDPDLKIPKSFLDLVKEKGIKVTAWRKGKKVSDTDQAAEPRSQNQYTDPNKVKIGDNEHIWGGEKVEADEWYVGYENDGSTHILSPRSSDRAYIEQLYKKIKDRVAKKQTFDDLLPAQQFSKNWRDGKHQLRHGDKGYKTT